VTRQEGLPSFTSSVALVARREITMRLRSRAFLVSTAILLLLAAGSVFLGSLASNALSHPKVAAVGSAQSAAHQVHSVRVVDVDTAAEATKLVKAGSVDAALIPSSEARLGFVILAHDSVPSLVVAQFSEAPEVKLMEPPKQDPAVAYLVAIGFGLVFFMSSITFGSAIAQSVVEEKQTRVVEILISAVPVRALLAGKVLGNSLLAFVQTAAIAGLSVAALAATGQTGIFASLGAPILLFVVFFIVGFVMLAALFAAAASLVSRQEDVSWVTTPVTSLVMIPYFLVIFFNTNPVVLTVMSYVPFSAPIGMPMRVYLGTAQWWEPLLSLVILIAFTAAAIAIGSRIYSNSLLHTGGRVKLKDALSGRN